MPQPCTRCGMTTVGRSMTLGCMWDAYTGGASDLCKCTSPSAGRREDIHLQGTEPTLQPTAQGICPSNSGAAPALCDGHWAERRSHITACAGSSHTSSRWWWPAYPEEDKAGIHNQIQSSHQRHQRDTHIKAPLYDHNRLLFSFSVNLGETVMQKEEAVELLPIERARETPWKK